MKHIVNFLNTTAGGALIVIVVLAMGTGFIGTGGWWGGFVDSVDGE